MNYLNIKLQNISDLVSPDTMMREVDFYKYF